jgi:hypothetical protein
MSAYYGTVNISKILEEAKKKHSSFFKSENGQIHARIRVYINEEPDKFGNTMKMILAPKKDTDDQKWYIANLKLSEPIEGELEPTDIPNEDDLPF